MDQNGREIWVGEDGWGVEMISDIFSYRNIHSVLPTRDGGKENIRVHVMLMGNPPRSIEVGEDFNESGVFRGVVIKKDGRGEAGFRGC